MANRAEPRTRTPRAMPQWLTSPLFYVGVAAALGFIVAQAVSGNLAPRWVKAIMGGLFLLTLLRLPLYGVVCLFLIVLPFPTFIYLGNTNIIFVLFMLVVWGVKIRMGKEPIPPKTYLDYACWAYIAVHILSLANVESSEDLRQGIYQIQFLAAAVGLYFLVSKVLRTERHLRIAFWSLAGTSLLVSITGVMEYFLPTVRLIPDWFIAAGPTGKRLAEGGRVGGVFGFHGLLADFCAMMFIVQAWLFIRTENRLLRLLLLLLMVAAVFQIFATANRGGIVIWGIGLIYLLWLGRGSLTTRRVVIALPILFLVGFAIDELSAQYGRYVSLWIRLIGTQFERGVPDTRIDVWREVLREIPNHLWFGHGPFFNLQGGRYALGRQWPHSAYLMYLWTTGVVGLAVFLWILGKVVWKSYPGGKLRLGSISFAHGAQMAAHIMILQFAAAQVRDEHQRGNVYVYLMWGLFGLAVAARRIRAAAARAEPGEVSVEGPAARTAGRPGG